MSPPRKRLTRGIPVEVEWVALVVVHGKCLTTLDGFTARQSPSFCLAVQRRYFNPFWDRTKPILRPFFNGEREYLYLGRVRSRYDAYDDTVLLRAQNDSLWFSVASNVGNGGGFVVPLGRWVGLLKRPYCGLRLGYLRARKANQNER